MHNEKITILFVINAARTKQKRLRPFICRITLNKKGKQFNTSLFVNSNYWENKLQKVTILEPNHKYLNAQLERIQIKIYNIVLVFKLQGIPCKLDNIYNEYKGIPIRKGEYILSCYRKYVSRIQKLIGREIKQNTYDKFVYVGNHLEAFIKWQFKKSDYPLKELSLRFLNDFDCYLKTEKSIKQSLSTKSFKGLEHLSNKLFHRVI